MIETVAEARALLERHRVLALTATPGFVSLVEAVAGSVQGSWWSHPRGDTIYALASALEDEALCVKAAAGKVAFVHVSLWPAVLRVVTDADFVAGAAKGLDDGARALLAAVDQAGRLRLDELPSSDKKALRAAKAVLESRFLCHVASEHTEKGRHEAVLRTWADWAGKAWLGKAARLALADARSALAERGLVFAPTPGKRRR